MSYRLKLREPLAEGLRRVGLAQIDMAEAKLRGQEDPATAVHDARRCLKRLRALLRLIRPGLEESVYQRESKRLAATGRLLAGARDRHVMLQTLRLLESKYGALPDGASERLANLIESSERAAPDAVQEARRRALSRLATVRKFFAGPALDPIEIAHVLDGMGKVYKKARRARRDCQRDSSDEAFHAWRKAVQQHWRHMQLLSRAWPGALAARGIEAKELSQLLGEDHDLAVLIAFARTQSAQLSAAELEVLEMQCRGSQEQLRTLADLRGARLLAEPAQDVKERLGAYWAAARKLSQNLADMPAAPAPPELPAPPPAPEAAPEQARAAPSRVIPPRKQASA